MDNNLHCQLETPKHIFILLYFLIPNDIFMSMTVTKKQGFVLLSVVVAVWQLFTAFTSVQSGVTLSFFNKVQERITSPCYTTLAPNTITLVPKECLVIGDVYVAPSKDGPFDILPDSIATTHLIVSLTRDAYVKAPYGASITGKSAREVIKEGCGSQCKIDHIAWSPTLSVCDRTVKPGETVFVKGGCVVMGDFEGLVKSYQEGGSSLNSKHKVYDDKLETGIAYKLPVNSSSWIKAPFGLTLTSQPPSTIVSDMTTGGCEPNGCEIVFNNFNQ